MPWATAMPYLYQVRSGGKLTLPRTLGCPFPPLHSCTRSTWSCASPVNTAFAGNMEAMQLLMEKWRARVGLEEALPFEVFDAAVWSGNVPFISWLHQTADALDRRHLRTAMLRGNLPMLRWLLESNCFLGYLSLTSLMNTWPHGTFGDSQRLVEALALVAADASPQEVHAVLDSAVGVHPWPVLHALLQLLPQGSIWPRASPEFAANVGCTATLEGLVGLGAHEAWPGVTNKWYLTAVEAGDRALLACLVRLGFPPDLNLGPTVTHDCWMFWLLPSLQWLALHGATITYSREGQRVVQREELETWLQGRARA